MVIPDGLKGVLGAKERMGGVVMEERKEEEGKRPRATEEEERTRESENEDSDRRTEAYRSGGGRRGCWGPRRT